MDLRSYVVTTTLLSICLVPLQADDFLTSGASARSAGVGGVYVSGSDNALDAMAMNPAGLALLNGTQFTLSAAAGFARGTFTNSANSNGRLDSNGILPYGAFASRIGKSRFTIGLAATPELMSAARWQYKDAPGGVGGVSYGGLRNNSEIMAMRTSAGIGIYVTRKLQIGATFGAIYNTNTLQTAYVFQSNPALAGLKTQLDLHTNGVGWNGSVGAIVHPSRRFDMGVSYKTRTTVASKGVATGNIGVQLAAIGLGAARPDFRYDARVDNVLPQSAMAHMKWSVNSRVRVVAQTEWINWKNAFVNLPVTLTHGDNADINGVLGTDGIKDSIPLAWKDQLVERIGIERGWGEGGTIRAGYAHANNPVPQSTLSPLTAAITRNTLSAGFGFRMGKGRIDLAYSIDPSASANVQRSILKSGEYDNSHVAVQTQMVLLSYTLHVR